MSFFQRIRQGVRQQLIDRISADEQRRAETFDGLIQAGNAAEDQGQVQEAFDIYLRAQALDPEKVASYLNLGNAALMLSQPEKALEYYEQAIARDPCHAGSHFNAANSLVALGRFESAKSYYLKAIDIRNDYADAYVALGNLEHHMQQPLQAIAQYKQALTIQPQYFEVYQNIANIYAELLQKESAVEFYLKALIIRPSDKNGHYRIALLYQELGKRDLAIRHAQLASQNAKDDLYMLTTCGILLGQLGANQPAEYCYRAALTLKTNSVEIMSNLGGILIEKCDYKEAIKVYQKILDINPNQMVACVNMGKAYSLLGEFDEAIALTLKVIEMNPSQASLYHNLGCYYRSVGQHAAAMNAFLNAVNLDSSSTLSYSNYLFCASHDPSMEPEDVFRVHCRFDELFCAKGDACSSWDGAVLAKPYLNIGFVSGDFLNHAVMNYFRPILDALLEFQSLRIHLFCNNDKRDSVTGELKSIVPHWHDCFGLGDDQLKRMVVSANIDVLIDLSGHTGLNRLTAFSRRMAPVQASWIGYPLTTGIAEMDYYIADRYFLPVGKFENQFREKIAYLPASCPFIPASTDVEINPLPSMSSDVFTFGSFNRPDKITMDVVKLWARALNEVPRSRILIGGVTDKKNGECFRSWFAACNINADRVVYHERCLPDAYMRLHHQVDMCLDTFPYSGATTTSNALWMGVPTLTLRGKTAAGRQSAAFLAYIGLEDEFSAESHEEFLTKAQYWDANKGRLQDLRSSMRDRFARSPIRQVDAIARGFEKAMWNMWERWNLGEKPESFEIQLT